MNKALLTLIRRFGSKTIIFAMIALAITAIGFQIFCQSYSTFEFSIGSLDFNIGSRFDVSRTVAEKVKSWSRKSVSHDFLGAEVNYFVTGRGLLPSGEYMIEHYWSARLMMWHLAVLMGVYPLIYFVRTIRKNYRLVKDDCRTRSCQACGYNLTGNESGNCPECGTGITRTNESVAPEKE